MKIRKLILSLLLLSLLACLTAAGKPEKPNPEPVAGKFSPDGMRLTIKGLENDKSVLRNIDINNCDGTSNLYTGFIILDKEEWIYLSDKPIQRVIILTIEYPTILYEVQSPNYTRVIRSCTRQNPLPAFACKSVDIAPIIYRSRSEPISFTSSRFALSAGLKLPGIDGLIPIHSIENWNHGLNRLISLRYSYRERVWRGAFPSLYIPVGTYTGVELVISNGFGQQAKCPAGDITVIQ